MSSTVGCDSSNLLGKTISYSDHEGVAARIRIKRDPESKMSNRWDLSSLSNLFSYRDFVRMQTMVDLPSKNACVQDAIKILEASLKSVKLGRILVNILI